MNTDELCAAVTEARTYLDRFTRHSFVMAFREYTERFGPAVYAGVRESDGSETALRAMADALLDELERGWKRQRPWNRGAVRVNEKQMMVDYLSPMLQGLEEPLCGDLARLLCAAWAERWPKDLYRIASFSEIRDGFRNSILGIDFSSKHLDSDRDR